MIDFHSHILPGIDDGSKDIGMSKSMLYMEAEQGVDRIIATPHFYASEVSMEHFIHRRDQAFNKVMQHIYGAADDMHFKLPEIICGAEVYYFPGMGRADLSPLCFEGTDLLLLEMPFAQWTMDVYEDVERIIRKQKIKIIMAHVERFYQFQKKKDVWKRVFDLPLIAQFNAGCLTSFGRRKMAIRFIRSGYPVLLGSDCHNISGRRPNLAEGRNVLKKKLGEDVLKDIDLLGERLLRADDIDEKK